MWVPYLHHGKVPLTLKLSSSRSLFLRHGRLSSGMSGAAMADRKMCLGMGRPRARASIRNSYAHHVPTLCATTCIASFSECPQVAHG